MTNPVLFYPLMEVVQRMVMGYYSTCDTDKARLNISVVCKLTGNIGEHTHHI